jgi:DNA-binding response OmpR family regulator
MHKGKITVASMPGKGSTFTVSLPLGKEHWRPEDIAAEEPIPKEVGADTLAAVLAENEQVEPEETWEECDSPVVLIVDDNADVRRYVRGSLQECYRIEEAENGKTGLAKVHERAIDLVITDVMMPAMDGLQFCKELKNDERTSHIPVIMLTAKASEDSKLNGLHTGADDYIVKPFDSRELIVRTTNLIELRRKLRKKYQQQVVLGPAEIPVTSSDERFLRKLAQAIEGHIMDAEYHTERLAYDMCMSRMQLNRKLRALTGYSTHELVREFRLLRAAELLGKHAGNVSEVALDVGFSSLSHFIKAFRERFGVVPSDYKANGPERPSTFEDAPSLGSHGGT